MAFLHGSRFGLCMPKTTDGFHEGNPLEVIIELAWALVPVWVAVLVGLVLGWSWKPRWISLLVVAVRSRPRLAWSLPPGFGARRLWVAATAASVAPLLRETWETVLAWSGQVQRRWLLMRERLTAITPDLAAYFPAGHLTRRAKRVLLEEVSEAAVKHHDLTEAKPSAAPVFDRATSLDVSRCPSINQDGPDDQLAKGSTPAVAKAQRVHLAHPAATAGSLGATVASSVARHHEVDAATATGSSGEPPVCRGMRDFSWNGCGSSECTHGELSVTEEDLAAFRAKLDEQRHQERGGKAGSGQAWSWMLQKQTERMAYTAWRRDPQNGPTEYCSRTVISDCKPDVMRDFFWDDDFRPEWDGMLAQSRTLEVCPATGFQVVQWVRKFPLFCKDREYLIARRMWCEGDTYYCITKGIDHPDVPRKDHPRRVDQFYSSWRISSVTGGSSECLLFHQEDMGIQRDVAKLGVRHGMWGAVKRIEPGMRSYMERQQCQGMSRSASMARLHNPVPWAAASPPETPQSGGGCHPGQPHGQMRKWVSLCDLHQAGVAAEERGERSGKEVVVSSAWKGRRVVLNLPSHAETGSPLKAERLVRPESPAQGLVPGMARPLIITGADLGGGKPGATITRDAKPGSERSADNDMDVDAARALVEDSGGRWSNRRWVVAATAVAFLCGFETGILVKLALAGAVKHALCSGRRRRDQK